MQESLMESETTVHHTLRLETRRLILRPLMPSDVTSIFHLYADWEVSKNLSRIVFPFSYQAAQQFIATAQTDLAQASGICWGCFSAQVMSLSV
jgi:RimJ/RimL family protein N-acetyltransferase